MFDRDAHGHRSIPINVVRPGTGSNRLIWIPSSVTAA
jgi:hypothetical protein